MPKKVKNIIVTPGTGALRITGHPPTVWLTDNYAEEWYRDAVAEARSGGGHDARRREIIFASCFAESFIFEWARDKLQVEEINDYFPPERRFDGDSQYRRDLKKKWKEVPKELYKAGKIGTQPNLHLIRFAEILRYRHGLIHAAASRPAADKQSPKTKPFPRKKDLMV